MLTCASGALVGDEAATTDGRSPVPNFEQFPDNIFFRDAFAEALVGSRPANLGSHVDKANPTRRSAGMGNKKASAPGEVWSRIVSRDTLEDAVKLLQISVDATVSTPTHFSGGGYQQVRREFSELAMLFAVIAEYDDEVRWQASAATARDLFARAAANAKVTSIQAYNDAKNRKQDLKELVRGGSIPDRRRAERVAKWNQVCDRSPLMERLTFHLEEQIEPWCAKREVFLAKHRALAREAELLKLVAVVLAKEGMDEADDPDYVAYCEQFGAAAERFLEATRRRDYQAARAAVDAVAEACSRCHEDYRG